MSDTPMQVSSSQVDGDGAQRVGTEWQETILPSGYSASCPQIDANHVVAVIKRRANRNPGRDDFQEAWESMQKCMLNYPVGSKCFGFEIWLRATMAHPVDRTTFLGLISNQPVKEDLALLELTVEYYANNTSVINQAHETSAAILDICHYLLFLEEIDRERMRDFLQLLAPGLAPDPVIRSTLKWLNGYIDGSGMYLPEALWTDDYGVPGASVGDDEGFKLIREKDRILAVGYEEVRWYKADGFYIVLDSKLISSQRLKLMYEDENRGIVWETSVSVLQSDLLALAKVLPGAGSKKAK